MNPNTRAPAGQQDGKPPFPHMMDEDDIGSGERSPGQQETDALVRQVGQQGGAPDPEAQQVGTANDLPDEVADTESLHAQQFGGQQDTQGMQGGDPARPHKRESIESGSLLDDVDPVPPKGN